MNKQPPSHYKPHFCNGCASFIVKEASLEKLGSLWFTEPEMVIMGLLAFTANIFLGTITTFVPTKII